jgi:SAM-dependent methyltransferase
MEERIFPCLKSADFSRILFIGCKWYTAHYKDFFRDTGIEYWTTDIDQSSSVWGAKNKHITCDVQELDKHFPLHSFDAVLSNGVFGWGVNDLETMNHTVTAIERVLKQDGTLLVGWNPGMIPDPRNLTTIIDLFEHESKLSLPERKSFEDHVYDFFTSK